MTLFNEELHKFCFEFHTLEKTIKVSIVKNDDHKTEETFKLEAYRDERSGKYSAIPYILLIGAHGRWIPFTALPPVHNADTADLALSQALGFLRDYAGG